MSVESLPAVSVGGEEGEERVFELISDGDLRKREEHDVGLEREEGKGDDVEIVQCLFPSSSSSSSSAAKPPERKRRKIE